MNNQNQLESLELKLKNAREENREVFEQVEKDYNENYRDFVESFFKTDVLGAKKSISALFQLEAFNGKKGSESLKIALNKGLKILPIQEEKRELLALKIMNLEWKKTGVSDIITKNTNIEHSTNSPILESLLKQKIINNEDILIISSKYETTKDIRLSLRDISKDKRDIILKYFYELNSTKKLERTSNFKQEYSSEIKALEKKYSWPVIDWVVSFVGRNFFKMKPYKKRLESKKLRLRRTFKIALLKMLRIKYSWFNIEKLLKQIDSLDDFESMFKLIMKLIDVIPENNELLEKFSIQEEVDEVEEVVQEAEWNKQKILDWEENIIQISEKIREMDGIFAESDLEELLDEDTDFIWDEVKMRKEEQNTNTNSPVVPFLKGDEGSDESVDVDDKNINIEEEYEKLKDQLLKVEKKKQKLFASWEFNLLDEINDQLLEIMVKMDKISKLMGGE